MSTPDSRAPASGHMEALLHAVNHAPLVVWALDAGGVYTFVQGAGLQALGVTPAELLGRTCLEVYGVDAPEWVRCAQRAVAGETFVAEVELKGRWYSSHYAPLKRPSGEVAGMVAVSTDVTERKAAERALKENVRTRDEFLSVATHELKTPVTSLTLQLQQAQRLTGATELPPGLARLPRAMEVSLQQLRRLTELVDDLLDVSRVMVGRLDLTFHETRLGDLVREVTERLRESLAAAGCAVTPQVDATVVAVWDQARIEQVLVILLTNAMKYAPGKPVEVSAKKDGTNVRLGVKDSGPGIPADKQQLIFERFERANASRDVTGLGVGLFIARQIVRGHGGRIWVESTPGQGATFHVELPLKAVRPKARAP